MDTITRTWFLVVIGASCGFTMYLVGFMLGQITQWVANFWGRDQ